MGFENQAISACEDSDAGRWKPIEVEWSMSVKFSRRDTNKLIIGLPAFVLGFKFSHSLIFVDKNKIIAMDSQIGQQQIERTPL